MYYLYDEDDRLLDTDPSPVGAELKKADIERRVGITVFICSEEK